MKYFLLVFDRKRNKLVAPVAEFADAAEALKARFRLETSQEELIDDDLEIVVLGAPTEQDLKNTHSRYFGSGHELTPA